MMKIVYQAYGRTDIIQQVLFSVTTLKARCQSGFPGIIEIYTDQVEMLEKFFEGDKQVRLVPLTSQQIKVYRGAIDFVHRVKLKILEQAAQNLEGNLIYLDGDTYFIKDPRSLFAQIKPNVSLMHICESRLDTAKDPLTKKIARFVRKNRFHIGGEKIQIPLTTEMWNAGVIGIHSKLLTGTRRVLSEMVELTDQMYGLYQKHVMEQLAVSYVLQEKTLVQPANFEIVHYWSSKEAFDQAIAAFLVRYPTLRLATENLGDFQWPAPLQRKEKVSWFKRLFAR